MLNNVALPRFPSVSPDGSAIVFAWRGDLWRVDSKGGQARRLTVNPFDDNFSTWSPDGRQIAFTSERVGGGNLFVMNADGSDVRQVSNTDRYLVAFGWDGDQLIANGRLEQDWFPSLRSYAVPLAGGEPTRLFDAFGSAPAVSPDGSKILFTRGTMSWSRRGYVGSDNRELWMFDRMAKSYTRVTKWTGNDGRAKWVDDTRFVFSSDREDGTLNLYSLKAGEDDSAAVRLTPNKGVDVEEFSISRDGRTLVYASWDRLYRVEMNDVGPSIGGRPIDIVADEDAGTKVQYRSIERSVSESAISPDGKAVAVIAFGQVYVRGTDAKSPTRRVNPTVSRCRNLAWSPDGSTLYFASDADGQRQSIYAAHVTLGRADVKRAADELRRPTSRPARRSRTTSPVIQPTSAATESNEATTQPSTTEAIAEATQPTSQTTSAPATTQASEAKQDDRNRWADALRFEVTPLITSATGDASPSPSPDGKLLAYERGQGQLWVRDLASGSERPLFEGWSSALTWRWSPDARHIAFVTEDRNNNSDIFIVPADGLGKPTNVTRHPDNDTSPRWSADGKMLAFLSERNDNEGDVYSVFLDRDLESLQGPDLDQYYKDAADRAKRRERPRRVGSATAPSTTPVAAPPSTTKTNLDLDDAYLRARRLTSLPGSEADLEISPAGDRVLFTAQAGAARGTYVLDRDAAEPKRIAANVNVQSLTSEGDKAVVVEGNRAATMSLATGQLEYLDVSDRLAVDVAAFNEQKFREAARILGEIYYDATMNGLDWTALTERYAALVRRVATPAEFDHLAAKFVGELNGSHLGISSPPTSNPDATVNGRLGIRAKREDEGYRVARTFSEGPSAKGTMRLLPDDLITAIEGVAIEPTQTLEGALANRVGKETLVTVTRAGREVNLLLTPITFDAEAGLAYDQWRRDTAARVKELSGGRLGYIHIRGMNQESLETFERDLFAAADGMDGLLVDVRNNGGGSTTDLLLGSIMYPQHAYTKPRGYKGSEKDGYPQDRLYIQRYNLPINLLCNEKSFSNAEIFSHAFKTLKRGTLIGQQTAGGVISTGATTLLDGTTVRLPNRGWYTPDGTNMELHGAMPDLVVVQTPEAESREDDEQLKAAVDDLLKRLPGK